MRIEQFQEYLAMKKQNEHFMENCGQEMVVRLTVKDFSLLLARIEEAVETAQTAETSIEDESDRVGDIDGQLSVVENELPRFDEIEGRLDELEKIGD